MLPSHRIVDLSIGCSILVWATAGTWLNLGQRPIAVLATTAALHLVVGILFIVRARPIRQGSLQTCLAAIPAALVGGWVFRFAPSQWGLLPQVTFVFGGGLAIFSFCVLGRCFAILPALRGTITHGPFSAIRHPAYLGECTMVVGCVLAGSVHWSQLLVLLITLMFTVVRIRAEEGFLISEPAYRDYCVRVRWRLIPFVW